jgi:hypothetical protein
MRADKPATPAPPAITPLPTAPPGALAASAAATLPQPNVPVPPATANPAAAAVSDPVAVFRRAIEEAQARQAQQPQQTPATPGNGPAFTSLPEAIEAARRAQLQAQPAATPASGAGINPFSRR